MHNGVDGRGRVPAGCLTDMDAIHLPVLLSEVIQNLQPKDGGIYVDGNLGLGGHTEKLLEASAPTGRVVGFEWDAGTLARAKQRLARFGDRLITVHRNFAELTEALADLGISRINGLLLDLGVSSLQLDSSGRGFSFQGNEFLDMRMDERFTLTAAELVNTATEEELADIFYYYGEERQARRIAAFIIKARQRERINTTLELVGIIKDAVPKRFHPRNIHVATKVFQALRITVNRELENLQNILAEGGRAIGPGGRICVISFHSLEDRLVKKAFRENPLYESVTKKPLIAAADEVQRNPRARSARLRVAEVRGEGG